MNTGFKQTVGIICTGHPVHPLLDILKAQTPVALIMIDHPMILLETDWDWMDTESGS